MSGSGDRLTRDHVGQWIRDSATAGPARFLPSGGVQAKVRAEDLRDPSMACCTALAALQRAGKRRGGRGTFRGVPKAKKSCRALVLTPDQVQPIASVARSGPSTTRPCPRPATAPCQVSSTTAATGARSFRSGGPVRAHRLHEGASCRLPPLRGLAGPVPLARTARARLPWPVRSGPRRGAAGPVATGRHGAPLALRCARAWT